MKRIFRKQAVLRLLLMAGIVVGLFLQSCSTRKITVPPITPQPTGQYLYGKFVWHDLLTYDVEAAQQFYGKLFGWTFREDAPGKYITILYRDVPIGGIVYVEAIKKKHYRAQWMSYLSVPEVDRAVEWVKRQGGEVLRTPREVARRGRMAVVRDPQGALLALLHSETGDPPDREPQDFEWLWEENLTNDVPAAVAFYTQLAGYTSEAIQNPQIADTSVQYYVLKKENQPRAGITRIPWQGVRPNWLPYLKVSELQPLVNKVEQLGGKVYLTPNPNIREGNVALIADPTGAVVALQIWPMR
jgi:predicted enzyme related to lactoylglutathione lyase